MRRTERQPVWSVVPLVLALIGATATAGLAQSIDPANDGSQYAWGENVGWINLQPASGPGVTVTDSAVTGFAWGENIGWINLSPAFFGGVVNDGAGRLSGYAWGENVGWINFAPAGGGVFIDACGEFNGTAYGENIGWISFRSDGAFPFRVRTSWVTPTDATPPVTSASGAVSGWSRTDVAVALSATDCGASVREVRYTLDSDPEVVTQGSTLIVTISSEGTHSLSYYSVDDAGNLEEANALTIRIDKSAPIVTLSSPPDGAVYVVNQNVAADFDVADSVSGVAGVVSTAADGGALDTATTGVKTFVVTALDHAGNSASATHSYSVVLPAPPGPRIISTLAGGGTVYGEGGSATAAALTAPFGIDFDPAGNLYIADNGDQVVRRVDAITGIITTVAGRPGVVGDCFGGGCGNGGPATDAALFHPIGIDVDASRNIYIADSSNFAVRKVDAATGVIDSIAGDFPGLCDGNGGPANLASLGLPLDVAVDAGGNVYIADAGCWAIRRIDAATGIIDNFAGSLANTVANGGVGGGDGGPAHLAAFTSIVSLSIDHLGNLYVVDSYPGPDYMGTVVRKIDAQTGIVTRVAGGGTGSGESGPATDAQIGFVYEVAVDATGNMYLAGDTRVWMVDPSGAISRFAGFGTLLGEGIPALGAMVGAVSGATVTANGDVLISDSPRVRRIFAVESADTIPPVIANVPADIVAEGGASGAIVVYTTPTAFDERNGAIAVTCAPASGSVFAIGETTVTCTAADLTGNTATATFRVIVADSLPNLFRVLAEFGHGGCAGNTEFDITGHATVQASSGLLGCASGFGEVSSLAGPGLLISSVDVTHTGFGTGTDMETQSELTVPFMLLSGADTTASMALNLALAGRLVTTVPNPAVHGWTVLVNASVDGVPLASGAQRATGSSGFPIPFPDGLAHAFSTNSVLVTTNTPHTLRLALTVSAASAESGGKVSLENTTLTLATTGPVFILPEGVAVADNPDLAIVGNRWTDPRMPAPTDTTPPVLAGVPPNIAAEATTPDGAVVFYAVPIAVDDRDGPAAVVCSPASGTLFALGVTSVTCTATDAAGNAASAAFTVSVADTTPPVIALLSPAGGASYYVGQNAAAAFVVSDAVSGVGSVASTAPFGSAIDTATAGDKAFTVTALDQAGNVASVTHTYSVVTDVIGDVIITGTNSPEIEIALDSVSRDVIVTENDVAASVEVQIGGGVGGDVTIDGNDAAAEIDVRIGGGVGGSALIAGNGNATINVDTPRIAGDVNISTGGPSVAATTGDGTTKVTLANSPATMTVLLPAGSLTSGVSFSIHSLGAEPPAEGVDGKTNPYVVKPLAAYQFAFGIPTLNSDATLTFDVNVAALGHDGAAEFLDALASNSATLAVRGDAAGSAYQIFAICAGELPTAGGCVEVARFDAGGAPIAPGDPTPPSTVRFTGVTGHFSTYALLIATPIPDTTAPVISNTPGDIVAEATSPDGASVDFALPTAEDDRDGPVEVLCAPGSPFPLGTTTVTCTATDRAGNAASVTFLVTVLDTTPPALEVPAPIVVNATSPGGAIVIYSAGAADNLGGPVTIACVPPSESMFPAGTTQVACTATDASGNQSVGRFSVMVRGAAAQIVDLIELVRGAQLPPVVETQLAAFLQTALGNPQNVARTCNALRLFILLVQAQAGRAIPADRAALLIAAATQIRAALGC